MFIDRVTELSLLEKLFNSQKAEFFALYGRRRVGKTELLTHFCKDKRAIFFVSDLGSEISQRSALSRTINAVLFGPDQMNAVYATWEDLFQALYHAAQHERLVVVLDEFPYLAAAYPPITTILQRYWDQYFKNSQIMLILCGSYIGMMEDLVLGYQAPLYGRRTGQYLLEPLQFKDASLFFSEYEIEDQVRTYAVYGGTPAYLKTIQTGKSLAENILEGILSRGSFLYDEVRFILQQELREPRNYFAILQAVAFGKTRLNEIKLTTGIDGANAYLDTLQQLHLIERIIPVTENKPQKSRMGLYRLKDDYLRFWFRFVHPNHSQLERGAAQIVLDTQVMPNLDHFTSLVFEKICLSFFWFLGLSDKLPFLPTQIGRWWRASEEIDLIALGEYQAILVECKWTNKPVGLDVLRNLEHKLPYVQPDLGKRKVAYAICARSGFTKELKLQAKQRDDLQLFGLEEIGNLRAKNG